MRIRYICEICGKKGSRKYAAGKVPSHFFCSVACQHEWQKTRADIVAKNKDPEFRKKVSRGLKQRKKRLGDDYHSASTKKKIGEATKRRWDTYDEPVKDKILTTLKQNAQARRKYGPYDYAWKLLSRRIRRNNFCHRCGRRDGHSSSSPRNSWNCELSRAGSARPRCLKAWAVSSRPRGVRWRKPCWIR